MFFWSYLPVLKVLALHCNVCNPVLQFKLGNKLHLCNRFSESCAFGYGWTSSGKPYCSSLKIRVSGLLCLSAKDCCYPHRRAAGQSASVLSRPAAGAGLRALGMWAPSPEGPEPAGGALGRWGCALLCRQHRGSASAWGVAAAS